MSSSVNRDPFDVLNIEKSGFILFGIAGIEDLIRMGVENAIKKCEQGGVSVKMITGDNRITAAAIAKKVSIMKESDTLEDCVIEGIEFSRLIGGVICKHCGENCTCYRNEKEKKKAKKELEMLRKGEKKRKEKLDLGVSEEIELIDKKKKLEDDKQEGRKVRQDIIKNLEEFKKLAGRIKVMARSRPEDKYAMILGLKELGHVVGVTGDGTNDAPALKKADVGFAMGITGTEVAKQAADILITDDNFASIVNAILWGRNIYGSVRKFLMFQLTVNVCAVLIVLVGAASVEESVFTPIQMLWVNLIMDTFASLALATEPPSMDLINDRPYKRTDYVINLVRPLLLFSHFFVGLFFA
jgi:Ca2+ transporting ATPase